MKKKAIRKPNRKAVRKRQPAAIAPTAEQLQVMKSIKEKLARINDPYYRPEVAPLLASLPSPLEINFPSDEVCKMLFQFLLEKAYEYFERRKRITQPAPPTIEEYKRRDPLAMSTMRGELAGRPIENPQLSTAIPTMPRASRMFAWIREDLQKWPWRKRAYDMGIPGRCIQ